MTGKSSNYCWIVAWMSSSNTAGIGRRLHSDSARLPSYWTAIWTLTKIDSSVLITIPALLLSAYIQTATFGLSDYQVLVMLDSHSHPVLTIIAIFLSSFCVRWSPVDVVRSAFIFLLSFVLGFDTQEEQPEAAEKQSSLL